MLPKEWGLRVLFCSWEDPTFCRFFFFFFLACEREILHSNPHKRNQNPFSSGKSIHIFFCYIYFCPFLQAKCALSNEQKRPTPKIRTSSPLPWILSPFYREFLSCTSTPSELSAVLSLVLCLITDSDKRSKLRKFLSNSLLCDNNFME